MKINYLFLIQAVLCACTQVNPEFAGNPSDDIIQMTFLLY